MSHDLFLVFLSYSDEIVIVKKVRTRHDQSVALAWKQSDLSPVNANLDGGWELLRLDGNEVAVINRSVGDEHRTFVCPRKLR